MNQIKMELYRLINLFKNETLPEITAKVLLPRQNVPCSNWSLLNKILCWVNGADDARGFRQWNKIGRFVKKGCKAFYILAPRIAKKKEENEDEDARILVGFIPVPVFRYQDTTGKPMPEFTPSNPPILREVADKWGITVRYPGSFGDGVYGYYSPTNKEIVLSTHEETTFCHELCHAAHERVKGKLKPGQDWEQEIVAELSSATLLRLFNRKSNEKYTFRYIWEYGGRTKEKVTHACMKVISEVEAVLNEILEAAEYESNTKPVDVV